MLKRSIKITFRLSTKEQQSLAKQVKKTKLLCVHHISSKEVKLCMGILSQLWRSVLCFAR